MFFFPSSQHYKIKRTQQKGWRKKERERESKSMSTLSSPLVPTSPRDNAIALYRAFKGSLSLSLSLSLSVCENSLQTCFYYLFGPTLEILYQKKKKKNNEFHNTYRLLHSRGPFISFLSIIFGSKWLILLFGFLFYCFRCMSYHMCRLMSPLTNLPKEIQLIKIWRLFLVLFGGLFFSLWGLDFLWQKIIFYLLVNI